MKYFMFEFMLPLLIVVFIIVAIIALSALTYMVIKDIFE
jgi:hypothetical protein